MLVVQFCENDDFKEVTLQASDEKQNKSQIQLVIRQGTDVMFVNMKLQEIKLYKSHMEKAFTNYYPMKRQINWKYNQISRI